MSSPTPARTPSALDALADRYVDDLAAQDPFLATELGIAGHDGEVTDYSPAVSYTHLTLPTILLV